MKLLVVVVLIPIAIGLCGCRCCPVGYCPDYCYPCDVCSGPFIANPTYPVKTPGTYTETSTVEFQQGILHPSITLQKADITDDAKVVTPDLALTLLRRGIAQNGGWSVAGASGSNTSAPTVETNIRIIDGKQVSHQFQFELDSQGGGTLHHSTLVRQDRQILADPEDIPLELRIDTDTFSEVLRK